MRRLRLGLMTAFVCVLTALAIHHAALMRNLKLRVPFLSGVLLKVDAAPAASPIPGFNVNNIDPKVKPCTNFFEYADGGWVATHPIPPAYSSWGTFVELARRNQQTLHTILTKDAAAHAPAGTNTQKLGDFYASCMNVSKINAEGVKPLEPEFKRIDQIHDLSGLQREIAHLQTIGLDAPFNFGPQQDSKNSTQEIAFAGQGGLGLPNRDYYTKQDAKSKQIRQEYVAHVTKMLQLLGDRPAVAASEAATVMKIETQLADASMRPVEMRNPNAVYHKMDLAQLKALTPNFSWPTFFGEIGDSGISVINVAQPLFFKELSTALTGIPLSQWKTYLRWHVLDAAAPTLSKPFVDEDFNFHGRELTGVEKLQPRWRRCVFAVNDGMGMALGEQYVKVAFPPSAKAHALAMVNNLTAELKSDISTLPWMGPQTRKFAIAKLQDLTKKIGYPDKWRDYSALHITRSSYAENFLRAQKFEFHREVNKIDKPVDRNEWDMTPPTVNAYYSDHMNEIVFPAGILQPPFFSPEAADAINYGAMGAVIGHEMTHGFDDEGRRFDAKGNLKNWWTPEDLKAFKKRAACIVNQFNGYIVEDHLHENGQLVQGESIADLGGLTIAYKAFEKSMAGKPHTKIGGYTPEQLFFLGFAQIWAGSMRPQMERLLVLSDPHPINRFRVNGPLSNMSVFAHAWQCKHGDAMVRPPNEQCKIW